MTGWCPYDGEVCHHDDYCNTCDIYKKYNKEQKNNKEEGDEK